MAVGLFSRGSAQQALTWEGAKREFIASNPTLRAGQIGIDEFRADEVTAYLRPNPDLSATIDQLNPFSNNPCTADRAECYRPFSQVLPLLTSSYLHERRHKRELRLESAQQGTAIAVSLQADLERNLLFSLRIAFVNVLQAKAVLALARESLAYYDKVLIVSRDRYQSGDIAQVDLSRLELERVLFESDVEMSLVTMRTAKIQLLQLLNRRIAIEQFDVTGLFDFNAQIETNQEFRRIALDTRPDLKAAVQAVDKAQTDHKLAVASGSTDPTFAIDIGRDPPIPVFMGFTINFPLRIFDRNQGEKLRTQLDISRNEKLREAAYAQVFSDVDSAYVTLLGQINLLQPYKAHYLQEAVEVRETISFGYQHGGASLLDFLSGQNDYRTIQRSYLNLVGSYLIAAAQLNLAVGREVIL
jgi:cobalt-zinc-cadmium efflux system outer membrane protein